VAQAAALLHHDHIVPVFGIGFDEGAHYYAMQLIDGHSLTKVIQELIAQASEELSATYLRDEPVPGRLVGVARATMIMAAQQQQQ